MAHSRKTMLTRLGRRLRARRLHLQLPLIYTAQQMQMTRSMLHAYESGRSEPPVLTLWRMAGVLGTDCSDLLGERARNAVTEQLECFAADRMIFSVANAMRHLPARHKAVLLATSSLLAGERG